MKEKLLLKILTQEDGHKYLKLVFALQSGTKENSHKLWCGLLAF
jgi:hypothetical protein